MSIYENISLKEIALKRPFRVINGGWNMFISGEKAGKPFKLKFESSTLCNLKCIMCPRTKGLNRKLGILTFENFKKVFDEINPPYLNLTGLGEPLLNPDIFKIIDYARRKGSIVKLDTNATLLNQENIIKLVNSNPSIISVSLDGITKKSFEKIRKGAKFDKIIENLKNLIKYRDDSKSKTQIHLFFVLQKDNIKDLVDFIKFGSSINVDVINGTLAISFGKAENKKLRQIGKEDIDNLKKGLEEIRKDVKTKINIEGIDDFLENPESKEERMKGKPCLFPWYSACITWDGFVVPCDKYCDNEIIFGNAFEEPFMKIWNNEKIKEFRREISSRKTREICQRCFCDESFLLEKMKPLYRTPIKKLSKRKL